MQKKPNLPKIEKKQKDGKSLRKMQTCQIKAKNWPKIANMQKHGKKIAQNLQKKQNGKLAKLTKMTKYGPKKYIKLTKRQLTGN